VSSPSCCHLHVHSEYSLLDGACKISQLVERAAAFDQPAVGLTDHGVMNGSLELFQAARKQGIKPLLGVEAYFCEDRNYKGRRGDADFDAARAERTHMTLLAETDAGFRNLVKICSGGFLDGYHQSFPRVDLELLERHSEGVIALSGCLASRTSRRIVEGRLDSARAHLDDLAQVFGPEDLYLEVMRNSVPEQERVNEAMKRFAAEMGRPLVATADVHYLRKEDHATHAALLCVQTKSTLAAPKMSYTNDFFLKSSEEMASAFADMPQALATTLEIADRCNVELEVGKQLIPRFDTPQGQPESIYLRELVLAGLRERYGDPLPAAVAERAEMELGVIDRMGYSGYFLIVWDFIAYARRSGIAVGPGRGLGRGLDRRLHAAHHGRRPDPP
jgi:DNA polymerase-3 subunit alpha